VSGIHSQYFPQFRSRPIPDNLSLHAFGYFVLNEVNFPTPSAGGGVR